mmetsp:Transcript_23635/g.47922  ORF Transcript_23635/g.47922 Transcript_23635/m.47922 type:complete len:363 (-) Transcript_23635:139-1227(-)|eukprot:CAMPEP_0183302784 /NCGR_PEP_ID=MMETSP0160_2-20130417/8444_1 /TAXON_ID=2839 ORGANISM="Odontella Sinensis, Strain Grunow 1884" /NCGR_SAMPLE_ID=MMETSP0160_2 /ASSEMBLY_ACC=CAM_ASM_000250 /LENGTH=362 /DNA_ID=CAMNT_0025465597 /DNA_START=136 /DNA_END=1224 /DNA_ORIENTATION=+
MSKNSNPSSVGPQAPVVARLLLPDDANIAGNVHGGTILKLMEQAGMIAATRFCNSDESQEFHGKKVAVLTRIETMSFLKPMFVGDVASVTVDVIFTSERSILTNVVVKAENFAKGTTRITNSGKLWYAVVVPPNHLPDGVTEPLVVSVPQILPPSENDDEGRALLQYKEAEELYKLRKETGKDKSEDEKSQKFQLFLESYETPTDGTTPTESSQNLSQLVLPGDCAEGGVAFGGFIMKLMDNAAGCCAWRHCKMNVVTVSIKAMNFTDFIKLGDIVTIRAIPVFVSTKSMEIEVTALSSSVNRGDVTVAVGTFVFVALDNKGKVAAIPPLRLQGEEEIFKAFIAQVQYEEAKRKRFEAKSTK